MKAKEIIQILTRGFLDIEKTGVVEFQTSDLSELVRYFGHYYEWSGHFKIGTYFYVWQPYNEAFEIDNPDLFGVGSQTNEGQYCLYLIEE